MSGALLIVSEGVDQRNALFPLRRERRNEDPPRKSQMAKPGTVFTCLTRMLGEQSSCAADEYHNVRIPMRRGPPSYKSEREWQPKGDFERYEENKLTELLPIKRQDTRVSSR